MQGLLYKGLLYTGRNWPKMLGAGENTVPCTTKEAIMSQNIDAFEYAPHIMKELRGHGALITVTGVDGVANPMTIGWGMLGVEWSTPQFIAYVNKTRYTHELLGQTNEFTVNVPLPGADEASRARASRILAFCGSKSGRDVNKAEELGLTLVPGKEVAAPAIKELPLTLECRIIYRRDQDISLMPGDLRLRYYPTSAEGADIYHTEYYGKIVAAYIAE